MQVPWYGMVRATMIFISADVDTHLIANKRLNREYDASR